MARTQETEKFQEIWNNYGIENITGMRKEIR